MRGFKMLKFKEIENYKDYGKCLSVSNGVIEAYFTLDLGPRIIRFGYVNGQNFMCSERVPLGYRTDEKYEEFFGKNKKWENLGGHRIWLSPESYPETYTPDDRPVAYEITESGAVFTPLEDTEIGVQKYLEIKMDPDDTNMEVIMKVKNISSSAKKFAVWGLSVCAQNGTIIIPTNTNDTGLLPNRSLAIWPYTDLKDERLFIGNRFITVHQDVKAQNPLKIGINSNSGSAFYVLGDEILCKKYETNHKTGEYPDFGSSFESYTNNVMLEFETLSELKTVKPSETSVHTEFWSLCNKTVDVDFKDEDSINNLLNKI